MGSRFGRILVLCAAGLLSFGAVSLTLMHVLPGPHAGADYLVIGTLSTFATLVTVFLVLMRDYGGDAVFFSRRKKK
jgi:hypothetical protein